MLSWENAKPAVQNLRSTQTWISLFHFIDIVLFNSVWIIPMHVIIALKPALEGVDVWKGGECFCEAIRKDYKKCRSSHWFANNWVSPLSPWNGACETTRKCGSLSTTNYLNNPFLVSVNSLTLVLCYRSKHHLQVRQQRVQCLLVSAHIARRLFCSSYNVGHWGRVTNRCIRKTPY